MMASMADIDALLSIPAFFESTVARRGDEPALGCIRGGELHWRTWRNISSDAQSLAAILQAAGIQPGDRVAQVSENRYEWIITDLAIHLAGAVHVPIHVTLSGEQMAEQIADCGARLAYVSNEDLLATFVDQLASDIVVFVYDDQQDRRDGAVLTMPRPAGNSDLMLGGTPRAQGDGRGRCQSKTPRPSLEAPGRATQISRTAARMPAVAPDDLATILFTSGTVGRPRGVMLSQANLATNAAAIVQAYGGDADETRLNILPLSHIYARTCDLYTWVCRGSRLVLGERRETLARDLQLVRPTTLSAVPYVYERISDELRARGNTDEATLKHYFGDRMKRLTCGGAALPASVEAWYAERGLPIHCGYGLTEASPVVTVSTRQSYRLGSVGRPLANIEARLADDGEVLVHGPSVMLGYWKDAETTAKAIRDGWLRTGDLGEIDGDGFLTIVGRKSEMIVLSTGKKVSPSRIEALLASSPLIDQAAVFGEGKSKLVALITPNRKTLNNLPVREWHSHVADEIGRCLTEGARHEQIGQFVLLDRPFSIERGELTAKLSLCRSWIAKNFATELATFDDLIAPLNASQSRR
jgi:long-chain acyl-CoA synthetase